MWSHNKLSLYSISFLIYGISFHLHAEGETLADIKPSLSEGFKIALAQTSAESGQALFMRKCSSCHDHEKTGGNGKGPHLWNLLNRKSGSVVGFDYSDAMSTAGVTWSYANLNYYLTRVQRAIPDVKMEFRGLRRDKDRVKLLAFLRTLHDSPPALPK